MAVTKSILGGQCPRCTVRYLRGARGSESTLMLSAERLSPPAHEPLPCYLGDYHLINELGRGGMGIVYRARQVTLNRDVAVKLVAPERLNSPKAIERFHAEAETAAHLDHPNIVPIYESGEI